MSKRRATMTLLERRVVPTNDTPSLGPAVHVTLASRAGSIQGAPVSPTALLNHISDALLAIDVDGGIQAESAAFSNLLGYAPGALHGRKIFDLVSVEEVPDLLNAISEALSTAGAAVSLTTHLCHHDGTSRDIELRVINEPTAPDVGGLFLIARDVTAWRREGDEFRGAKQENRELIERIPAIVYSGKWSDDGVGFRPLYVSPQLETMTGYTQKEWLADQLFWRQTIHPDDLPGVLARDEETNATGAPYRVEYRLITRDGRTLWINEEAHAELDEHGQIARWQGVMLDVTEQRLAEENARERASQFQFVYAVSPLPMWIYDIETLAFLDVNDAAITHYGYSRETFLGMRITDIRPEEEVPRFLDYLNRTSSWNCPSSAWTHRTNDGRLIEVEIAAHSLTFAGRSANLAVINDVTARNAREEELANQAFHDALTGLPNRALFIDRLEHALARASRQNSATAVLFVDLDNFKAVNDTLGHTAGDQLLVAAGQRLAACARTGDTIARLGGDEFTVLLEDISSPEDAIAVAECVLASLDNAFVVGGQDIHVTPSIGIATTLPGHDAPEDLLRGADLAMYEAKRHGRSRFALLDTALNARVRVRLELETDLRRGIDES